MEQEITTIVRDKLEREGKKCEFEYEGRKCKCTDIIGISRCRYLCETHFNTVRNDNIRKFNRGEEIFKDMKFTRKLLNSEKWSRFGGTLGTEEM